MWEFPGSPVVRTPRFHCRGQVQSLVRELRSCMPRSAAKKKKEKKKAEINDIKQQEINRENQLNQKLVL